jgi:molybdopterin-guanine dinucleotide biosynthesis protein A
MRAIKPLVQVGGISLIERVTTAVASSVSDCVIVTGEASLSRGLGCELLEDIHPDRGPLAGIHAASVRFGGRALLVAACDYPFLEPRALRHIVETDPGEGAVVPEIDGRLHPLCALYSPAACALAEGAILKGQLPVLALLSHLPTKVLPESEFEDARRVFFNVNTPEDLRQAEVLFAQAQSRR